MNVQLHPMNHMQVTLPNYSYVLNSEKNFVYAGSQALMKDRFPNYFYYCPIYVLLILGGRRCTSSRTKNSSACFIEHSACFLFFVLVEYYRNCTTYQSIMDSTIAFVYLGNYTFIPNFLK